jgi:hypothetical protein
MARWPAGVKPPRERERPAWALWANWCRLRGVAPWAPQPIQQYLAEYHRDLAAWGHPPSAAKRYGWVVRSLLGQLGLLEPPRLPLGRYEAEQIVDAVARECLRVLSPDTLQATIYTRLAKPKLRRLVRLWDGPGSQPRRGVENPEGETSTKSRW